MERAGNLTLDLNADLLRGRMTVDWYAERTTGRHVDMLALHRHDVADLDHRARAQLLANRDLGPVVLGDDTLHQEAGYTSITRGRELNHVYAIAAIDPDSPTADLQRALAISTAKQTAHDRGGIGL